MLKKILIVAASAYLLSSCNQDEGLGGSCTIYGTLRERVYNEDYTILLEERIPKDEDLFLLFGNKTTIGDKTKSGINGDFKFNYLWPGNYTLYYYSEDSLNSKAKVAQSVQIELSGKKSFNLDTLYFNSTKSWNKGNATIKGKVMVLNYKKESKWPNLILKNIYPAQEHEIYLTYGNASFYNERIRTQDDGTFYFNNLIRGNYRIFLYSDDVTEILDKVVIEFKNAITTDNQVIDLGDITIENL
jgi:hypothetical protein